MALFDRNNRSHLFDPGGDQQIAVNDEQGQALARGSQVGGAGLSNRIKNARSRGARNRGHGTTMSIDNAEAVNLPGNTAWLDTGPSDVPYGARGRDPGGFPKVIPVGVPPAVAGAPHFMEIPKELRIPALPTNLYQKNAVPVPAAAGSSTTPVDILDEECAFPIGTLYIHNMSTCWLLEGSSGMYIPPNTVGWVIPAYRKSSKIHVQAAAPPGHAQPALTAGQCISVVVTESVQAFSPGVGCPVA
jgi:hypothetical protein